MPLSVAQLLKPNTTEQNMRFLLDTLASIGFSTTSWVEGTIQRNILEAVAETFSRGGQTIRNIVQNTLTQPTGDWLDLVGVYRFGVTRLVATRAVRDVDFTCAASAGPHVILAGSYIISGTVRFIVDVDTPLASGATETISCTAEFAGSNGNKPPSDPVSLQTVYTGVTVAFNGEPTTPGTDDETDTRYWYRCGLRWAELTYSVGLPAYEFWALTAAPSVARAKALNNYPTENLVRVVLDPGTAGEIAAVEAYVAGRHPPNDIVSVSAATLFSQAVVYSPRVPAGLSVVTMNERIQDMFDALPIGGTLIAGASAGRILREKIAEVLLCDLGCQSSGIATPASDVILGATDIVQGTFTCTPEVIT